MCVCAHVHLHTPEPPWRALGALPDFFLMWFLIPGSFSAPDVGHMAKPFRRRGLRSQPALEDADRSHTQGLSRGCWSWEASQGHKDRLETPPQPWGRCTCTATKASRAEAPPATGH